MRSGVASDLFLDLTPDRVLEAVETGGWPTTGLCYPLGSYENRVYEVELVTGERLVAKFYRPGRWSPEAIQEEHAFLAELAAEEVPVLAPRSFPGGGTLRAVEGIPYALWDRFGGRAPDELDGPLAERLGRLVARIHTVGARERVEHRRPIGPETYVHRALQALDEGGFVPSRLAPRYRRAAEEIARVATERLRGVPTLRVHGDLHLGNLLRRDDRLWVLDFDDMAEGPAMQDLWLAIPGRDEDSLRLRQRMVAAYRELRDLPAGSERLVEPLRGMRMVRYAGWIARRWEDPAFRASWPDFPTPEHWERETEDLEAQAAVLADPTAGPTPDGASPRGPDPAEGEGWTNADYFFDWEG